jgi:hypothetical protein
MAKGVIVTADEVYYRHRMGKVISLSLIMLLLFLILIYIVLRVIYNGGNFTVTLDSDKTLKSGINIYESIYDPTGKSKLYAENLAFMDNISGKWIPSDINEVAEGSHNGENYIAYTFYVENKGDETLNYWYKIIIDDVVRNVDKAVRVKVYENDTVTTYARANELSGEPETNTEPFRTDSDGTIVLKERTDFKPEDRDKYTIVIWIEGDDPDCIDALIGGEIKMHMDITEEHIKENE